MNFKLSIIMAFLCLALMIVNMISDEIIKDYETRIKKYEELIRELMEEIKNKPTNKK